VRVPPKLMAPQRRAGRARGKSDPIDALAVARAALREPRLDHPRPGEQRLRELKLLVDHRDDLIDERRRAQQRLRWHLQRARVGAGGPARCARPRRLARPIGPPPRRPRAVSPGADRARAGRPLPRPHTDDPRPRARAADSGRSNRASALGATRLWRRQRRQAARRDRPDRALRDRRPACPPRRRRTTRSQLRQVSTPPARPRRQPPTHCALHRIAITQARVHAPARAYLERKQGEGKSRREALRCLKRQLARTVYTTLKSEALLT
jgi:transposase